MLRKLKDLDNFALHATDGEIGQVKDFYFDDDDWVVRYFVVETGSWLLSRQVLITPLAFGQPDWLKRTLPVSITTDQVKHSPDIDTDQPVSRQNEQQYLGYYGYPSYWGGGGMWGEGLYPYAMLPGYAGMGGDRRDREQGERDELAFLRGERDRHRHDDPHLRSCKAVNGYQLHAEDGDVGHVAGYLVDDETWAIRYLIVETGHWWAGNQVLVAPAWITNVGWSDETVSVALTRAQIQGAPAYDADQPWDRSLETRLHQHYGRTGSWGGLPVVGATV